MQRLIRWATVTATVAAVIWALNRAETDPPILMASQLAARVLAIAVGAGALWVGSSQAPQRSPGAREWLAIGIIVGAVSLAWGWRQYRSLDAERQAAATKQQSYPQCKANFDATHPGTKDDAGLLLWAACGDVPAK